PPEHEHEHDHEHEHFHDHEQHHDHDHHHDHEHHHEHGHHHADEVFTSWGRETSKQYTKETLDNILSVLSRGEDYGFILRTKGIVQSPEGTWLNFDLTPGEYEIREGNADYTGKLCVIGTDLDEDGLVKLFEL
ncbi:MAG: cobalamin biosynthesis protein CobW, partial [Lachnospiraceae bacterium]|nr:cobalamin biosynthesis protein CobW [Lachnospiraceae bacterium]